MNYLDLIKTLDRDFTAEELCEIIRGYRNRELAASDWTQLADCPISNQQEWATYRQELRDLPSQGADPKLWVFPERP